MRILVVADVSPVVVLGGGERMLWEPSVRLAARGHAVRIVSRAAADAAPVLTHHGVPVRHFAVDRRSLVRFIRSSIAAARRAVAEEIEAHGADVLHLHQPLSALGALGSPAGRRVPSLYTFHSPAPLEYLLRRGSSRHHRGGPLRWAGAALLWGIERACLARATRILVLSEFSARHVRGLYRIGADRIVQIPGGVDVERFQPVPDRAALKAALGLPTNRRVLLTVRNLERRMGLDALLEAFDRVRCVWPDVLLLIGGAGSLRDDLEARAAALGLGDHVRFLGYVPEADLPRYYAAADAFVLPTRALEGFGLVAVEALACGTPVLGTPVGAIPEILTPLEPSLVFADATPQGIVKGLVRFLDVVERDPAGAERLRQACRRHAEQHYGWNAVVDRLEASLSVLSAAQAGCAACGGPTRTGPRYGGKPYRLCARCGTATVLTPPDPAHLREHYDREYPARFAPDHITTMRRAVLTSLLTRAERWTSGRRLVDIGCGGGHLLVVAAERGWWALGIDVSHEACAAALKSAEGPVVQADGDRLPLVAGAVGAATLVNVLDHFIDPSAVLAEVHRVLTPGGVLVIRVLNGRFHRTCFGLARWLGPLARWTGLAAYPVLHLHAFTARGLRRLVEAAGFEVLEVRNSPPAAEGPAWTDAPADARLPALRVLTAVAAGAAAVVSGGRWLLAPSIELYARQQPGPSGRSR